ncbi:MAG: Abi-alpha family protein, partial [Turicibacter sp.]|nr:Abi-alpha family protein [Turicibacter sp.]
MGTHTLKIEAPECLSEPIKEVATPVAKSLGSSAGNTLSTAWELVFGGLDTKLEKVRYKRQKSIESFKAELDNKIEQIPSENLIEAKMHIVGPILEASKYYFEEEDLRAMFSSLIAS